MTPDRHTVLVVDDDPRIRFLVQRILERSGYAVRLAGDAIEAALVLRWKLEADPSRPVYLVATPGVGYCLLPTLAPDR
jgi:CheY-like chemotaxis protein